MSVQFPHSTLIPEKRLNLARANARAGQLAELESLLWFRENVDDWKAEGALMQAYSEYAEAMMIAKDSLRRKMATIRNFPADKLVAWIDGGVGFEHMDTANTLAELAHKTPVQLIDEAIEKGGADGKPMTVDELTSFALGEQKREPAFFRVNALLSRLAKFPLLLKWDNGKSAKFTAWLDAGREFFQ